MLLCDRRIPRSGLYLLDLELDHHVFGDLPAFGGTILQALETLMHLGNAAFEPGGESLIGQRRSHMAATISCTSMRPSTVSARVCSSICGLVPGSARGLRGS